ncbi:MAG TPA: hypothetical protein DCP53_06940 [Elusimicrobia bacterium]|nr:hypothetical protein [Elusimicrobiota bacterium]
MADNERVIFRSSRRGLSEAPPGEAEGQVPQPPKNYERNSHRGAFLLLTFLYASKEKLAGVQGRESPATLYKFFLSKYYKI